MKNTTTQLSLFETAVRFQVRNEMIAESKTPRVSKYSLAYDIGVMNRHSEYSLVGHTAYTKEQIQKEWQRLITDDRCFERIMCFVPVKKRLAKKRAELRSLLHSK